MSVVKDGYNFREKSKWLENVLDIFLARNEWEGALLSELVVRSETIDVFSLSKAALQNLDLKIAEVDGRNKSLGASRSSVIRAAINRHLLGI